MPSDETAAPAVTGSGCHDGVVSLGIEAKHDVLRPLMFAIASRMLDSVAVAEDVVQEGLVRLHGADDVRSPEAFATTVTTRLAIDALRSARVRRECYVGPWLPEPLVAAGEVPDDGRADRASVAEALVDALHHQDVARVEELLAAEVRLHADGSWLAVMAVQAARGHVVGLQNQLNPDKLTHLGPVGDLAALLTSQSSGEQR